MCNPLVSVIIPLFNKEKHIERAIRSVATQSFSNWELIIIDDGSTDNSLIVAKQACHSLNAKIISQENRGPGAARNVGLKLAKGQFVSFLDADDEWLPSFLEITTSFLLSSKQCDLVTTSYFMFPLGDSMVPSQHEHGLENGVIHFSENTSVDFALYVLSCICPWSTLVNVDIIKKYGGFFDKYRCLYGEDSFLWLKIILNEPFGIILKPLVNYHTEASECAFNLRKLHEVPPMLLFPDDIRSVCPEKILPLLNGILESYALDFVNKAARFWQGRLGKQILNKFPSTDSAQKNRFRIHLNLMFSPILSLKLSIFHFLIDTFPSLYFFYRNLKYKRVR